MALLQKQDIVKGSPEAKFEKADARNETALLAALAPPVELVKPELPNGELAALAAVAPAFEHTR
ncbi:MAG: hypothetical protein U0271_09085 [Polyangiaceae bacterium]